MAGSRPYQPGDDVDAIDWAASARLSSARGTDEFVVRERYAEEAPRVVVVCDRRAGMGLFPPELPWLRKPDAMRTAVELIVASAARSRGFAGYLDVAGGEPFWQPPRSQASVERSEEWLGRGGFDAPADGLAVALAHLEDHARAVPSGSFVFVLSDFLVEPPDDVWLRATQRRWDVVPVVIQDPTWERSFPDAHGIALPVVDAATGRRELLRLSAREARGRREANEARARAIDDGFLRLRIEPVTLTSAEPERVLEAFLHWSDGRAHARGAEWRAA
ncbi:MAG TPA: DUF58 domain-containing protein [Gaiellaceae bacterium]|nr:DUF58 domain-containing protein [Gaiellaceae bacterium]